MEAGGRRIQNRGLKISRSSGPRIESGRATSSKLGAPGPGVGSGREALSGSAWTEDGEKERGVRERRYCVCPGDMGYRRNSLPRNREAVEVLCGPRPGWIPCVLEPPPKTFVSS